MSDKLKLVAGDTGPDAIVTLTDKITGTAINVSDPATTVVLQMWVSGDTAIFATIPCTPIPGFKNEDGTIDFSGTNGMPGGGGRVLVRWTLQSLAQAGMFKAQFVVTLPDGTQQTTYDLTSIQVRERQLG